jgi:hypothetical protein
MLANLWKLSLLFAAIVLVLIFIPFRSRNCPDWDVWVSDPSGQPVSGVTVRLSYWNYSAERQSHEIDSVTDTHGHAAFASQTLSASLGRRAFATVLSATAGVHTSFGPHAAVFAFANGLQGFDIDKERNLVVDWTGKPDHMESRIVVAPRKL